MPSSVEVWISSVIGLGLLLNAILLIAHLKYFTMKAPKRQRLSLICPVTSHSFMLSPPHSASPFSLTRMLINDIRSRKNVIRMLESLFKNDLSYHNLHLWLHDLQSINRFFRYMSCSLNPSALCIRSMEQENVGGPLRLICIACRTSSLIHK